MNYNDFSELREAAWGYLHEVGNAVIYNREGDIDVSVKRLHAAIKAIDLGEMRNVLNGVPVHTTAILDREGFPSVMESVKKLRGFCQRYRKDIKAYDPGVKSVGRFCNDTLPAMEEELARLKERAKSEPTEEDIEAADTIRDYLSGEDDDIPFNELLHNNVFFAADNNTLVRRGNYLARQFNGVKHGDLHVGIEISRYVDEQLEKRAKLGSIKGMVHGNDASNTTPPTDPGTVATSLQQKRHTVKSTTVAETPPKLNSSALIPYFEKEFRGIGENSFNYFESFIIDLPTIKKRNEIAMVAVLVFHSRYFIKRKMSFADWMRTFFDIMGEKPQTNLSETRYEPSDKIKHLFRYL